MNLKQCNWVTLIEKLVFGIGLTDTFTTTMLLSATTPSMLSSRLLSLTGMCFLRRIKEVTNGNLTTVELETVPEERNKRYFRPTIGDPSKNKQSCACALCQIPLKITYKDVLILEQYMRVDGTVLPQQLTGLCKPQQQRLERCVMQAHWSGLFPDRSIPEFDRSGYKRFNRHWDNDLDMFRLKFKMQPGSWYYIKRYNPREAEYKDKRIPSVSAVSDK